MTNDVNTYNVIIGKTGIIGANGTTYGITEEEMKAQLGRLNQRSTDVKVISYNFSADGTINANVQFNGSLQRQLSEIDDRTASFSIRPLAK